MTKTMETMRRNVMTGAEMAEVADLLKRVVPKGEWEADMIDRFVKMWGRPEAR